MSADDYEAIRRLIHAYPARLDEGDLDGVADLFADAVLVAGDGSRFEGRDTLRDLWGGAVKMYDGSPKVRHLVTNVSIELGDGGTTASASSYVLVMQALPELPLQPVAVSTHDDRFAKVDGEWRFTERRDRQVLVGDLSHHMNGA